VTVLFLFLLLLAVVVFPAGIAYLILDLCWAREESP